MTVFNGAVENMAMTPLSPFLDVEFRRLSTQIYCQTVWVALRLTTTFWTG